MDLGTCTDCGCRITKQTGHAYVGGLGLDNKMWCLDKAHCVESFFSEVGRHIDAFAVDEHGRTFMHVQPRLI